jgi:hypothetical protein
MRSFEKTVTFIPTYKLDTTKNAPRIVAIQRKCSRQLFLIERKFVKNA